MFRAPKVSVEVKSSLHREQVTELTVPVALAMLEGGFVGVIADKIFQVPPWVLALLTSAAFFGNLSSYFWSWLANARAKVPIVVALQVAVMACLIAIALAPASSNGAVLLVSSVVLARVLVAGTITVRSVIWSLNYARHIRARMTGRLQLFASLVMVLTTLIAGPILDAHPTSFRWLYVAATVVALLGIVSFSRIEVSGELRHRVHERRYVVSTAGTGPFRLLKILFEDRAFARFELHQFLSGVSNMLLEAPLIYLVSHQMQASYTASIAVSMIIPFAVGTVTLPLWARYLDTVHVTEFRVRIGLVWVASQLLLWVGAMFQSIPILMLARAVTGYARGGGMLAWQIGHNDFADTENLSAYMAVHVTLTGIRGAFSAFLGIVLYLGWSNVTPLPDFAGMGAHVFMFSAVLGTISWLGFVRLRRDLAPEKIRPSAQRHRQ